MSIQNIEKKIKELQNQKKAIAKANANFKAMSPAQKRVAVAKDVLAQIKAKKYIPTHGEYVELVNPIPVEDEKTEICGVDLGTCNVCARGAMFVSAAKLFNKISFEDLGFFSGEDVDYIASNSFSNYESNFFGKTQIKMIETFFEGYPVCSGSGRSYLPTKTVRALQNYRNSIEISEPDEYLKEIMNNIIKNKGMFVIPKQFFDK